MLPANGLSLFWLSRFGSSEGWLIWLRKQDHNFVQLTNKNMHACPCPCSCPGSCPCPCSCSLLVIDTLGYRLSRSHLLPARAVWRRFLFESRKKAVAIVLSPALLSVLSLSLPFSRANCENLFDLWFGRSPARARGRGRGIINAKLD